MDRAGANFSRVVGQVVNRLGARPVRMQLPIGSEETYKGVVDLVKMKAIFWNEDDQGTTFEERDIPADMLADCERYRSALIEAAAEASEEMMDAYLENGSLTTEQIKEGIRKQTISNEIFPMFCGSAFKNKGVQAVLDAVIEYLPSPLDVPPVKGEDEDGNVITRSAKSSEPFCALAFKIATDPFVGTLTYVRVYSGSLKAGDSVYNPIKGKKSVWVVCCRCIRITVRRLKKFLLGILQPVSA